MEHTFLLNGLGNSSCEAASLLLFFDTKRGVPIELMGLEQVLGMRMRPHANAMVPP